MNKLIYIVFTILITPLAVNADIKLEGSSTILPIIKDIKKTYHKKIKVKGGGSTKGIESFKNNNCDIAMVSRELTQEEKALGLVSHVIGYDGIAIIANSSVPVDGLNSSDIVDIYSAKVTNWINYSNKNEKITVISKEDDRATKKVFSKFFKIKKVREDAILIGSNTEGIIFVASQPASIGYVSIGTAINAKNRGSNIKLLHLNGIKPTKQNISNKKYPIIRPLNLVTFKKISKEVEEFIAFVQSPRGQKKVQKRNFVSIKTK